LHYDLTEHITVRYSQRKIKVLIFSCGTARNSQWYATPAIDFSSALCADVRNEFERREQNRIDVNLI